MIRLALLTACLLIPTACTDKAAAAKAAIKPGTFEGSTYRHESFGFSIDLPEEWHIPNAEAQKQLMEMGGDLVSGDDKQMAATLEAGKSNTTDLFTAFRHPVGTPVAFNPSVVAVAEYIGHMPGIKSGADYHFHTRRLLQQSAIQATFEDEITTETIGGRELDVLHAEIQTPVGALQEEDDATIVKEHVLVFIISSSSQQEAATVKGILETLSFTQ